MSEAGPIILLVMILFAVYFLVRTVKTWRAGRACRDIIRELETRGAYDSESAVDLNGVQRNLWSIGVRNFRPEGMQMLLLNGLVEITRDGKYYLKDKQVLEGRQSL
ncbi:MAG: hypothetical protein KGY38_08190 [Desulfobacterales bacterium]|nr:hypothetical protein [Desulfobacterales bacterium]